MTENLVPFSFKGAEVRTVVINGDPAFVGKDICDRLGYANPNKAMNDHCKGVTKRYPLQTPGGVQEVRVLFEPDVLRLIIKSKLPEAEEFERWVFEEVLPAIRKTGGYMVAAPEETPEEIMLRALTIAKETVDRQKLELEVANERANLQEAMLVAARPKIDALDRISTSDGSYGLQEAAKILQVGPRAFVQWLRTNRWIYKRPGSTNYLGYQEKINAGYLWHKVSTYETANGETRSRDDVKILPKGLTRLAREVPGASLDHDLSPVPVPGDAPVPFTQAPA